jgi:transposase
MTMLGKIRAMHMRDGKSISEIARLTSLSRNTIKKWLKASASAAPKYRRREVPGKLAPHVEQLLQALKADAQRPKRERRTVKALCAELKAAGYTGGYTRLTDYVRAWRIKQGASISTAAFVPLTFALGEAFQFDWSEEGLVVGGIYRRLQVAHMKLCASRAFWLVAYPTQGHEMLLDAHTRGFAALGGIPRRGIYDNMKTAVDKVHKGKGRVVNARFAALCAYYLVDADFCNVASGWEKGRVEKSVQDSRRRIWIDAARQRFANFDELNAWLAVRCRALWSEVRHPEHGQFSVAEVLEHERAHLMPMPEPFDGYVEQPARVSSTCLVAVQRNRYSVPCELAGQMVSARLYPTRVVVVADEAIVASHERLADRGQTHYDWQHYIPLLQRKPGALRNGAPFVDMPEPLLKLQAALMREPGGDRVMATVLAAVPAAGLEAVLVAVQLVLEGGTTPSGKVSAEHVINVLGRLNAAAVPQSVDTALSLNEAPRADTQRYDALRTEVAHKQEVRHA